MSEKRIIVLVGASGSGKTTVGNLLTKHGIPRLVTSTTRPMREGEVDGVDYHFLTLEEMDQTDFVEQTTYNGNTYGLTVNAITEGLNQHDVVNIVMDKNGARAVKQLFPKETCIIYLAVTKEQMAERMAARGDKPKDIDARIRHAEKTGEFDRMKEADLMLQDLSPEENVEWILAISGGVKV